MGISTKNEYCMSGAWIGKYCPSNQILFLSLSLGFPCHSDQCPAPDQAQQCCGRAPTQLLVRAALTLGSYWEPLGTVAVAMGPPGWQDGFHERQQQAQGPRAGCGSPGSRAGP